MAKYSVEKAMILIAGHIELVCRYIAKDFFENVWPQARALLHSIVTDCIDKTSFLLILIIGYGGTIDKKCAPHSGRSNYQKGLNLVIHGLKVYMTT